MKIIIIFNAFFVSAIILSACTKTPLSPEDEKKFWSAPSDEAIMLFFRAFDSVRLDSLVAGEIQFRLDLAKNIVNDSTIKVRKDWVFGDLLLYTNQELYDSFDSTKLIFNNSQLDSLFSYFEMVGIQSHEPRLSSYFFHLLFPQYYNMVVISEIFSDVNGVIAAEQNVIGGPPICKKDISLIIEDKTYKFLFHGNCPIHFWEVHVLNDSIINLKEWD